MVKKSITLIGICFLLSGSVEVTKGIVNWIMPALEFSRAWVYGACPVGCVFMVIYCVTDIISDFKTFKL